MSAREDDVSTQQGAVTTPSPEPGLRVVHAMGTTPAESGASGSPGPISETDASGSRPDAAPVSVTWLPVAEAAERTSVSESALRKWIKAGELATRDAPGPRGLRTEVTVEAVVQRARLAGIDASPRAGLDLADAFARLENLTGQLIAMSDRAARAEVERDHLKRRLDEVKAEHSSAAAGERRRTDTERARADDLVAQLASSREALTAERARADAMLAAVPRRKRYLFERPASGVPGDRTVPTQGSGATAP
jgi:hypothetical protein